MYWEFLAFEFKDNLKKLWILLSTEVQIQILLNLKLKTLDLDFWLDKIV